MKDKTLIIKVDEEFTKKVDYLQRINDYKNRSDTVRKVVEKEYRKEAYLPTPKEVSDFFGKAIKEKEYRKECLAFPNCQDCKDYVECDERAMNRLFGKEKEK